MEFINRRRRIITGRNINIVDSGGVRIMKLTLGKKMVGSFAVILLLLVAVGFISFNTIRAINKETAIERENSKMRYFFSEKVTDHLIWITAIR